MLQQCRQPATASPYPQKRNFQAKTHYCFHQQLGKVSVNLKEFLSSNLISFAYNLVPNKSKLFTPRCIFMIYS